MSYKAFLTARPNYSGSLVSLTEATNKWILAETVGLTNENLIKAKLSLIADETMDNYKEIIATLKIHLVTEENDDEVMISLGSSLSRSGDVTDGGGEDDDDEGGGGVGWR